ncbi:hypothetical protein ANANG_G00210950 [Anguilla anguilla]|uniref:Sushi domain-containing protein n=1 Tax=Anguilla anguilla TaxID=7936 RepID=A0A9D3M1D8_ANGAN|nr:hypothetical protein ANANG_G00210950 [Anguilla anguilla]
MSLSEGSVRPSDLLAQFKQAGPRTKAHIWAAEVLDNTVELIREMVYTNTMTQPNITELLSVEDVETLLQASGCSAELRPPVCATDCLSQRYRTITGECNNRQHPLWGAANTPYTRWLPPEYEDGRAAPRGWDPQHTYHNFTLPPVRSVSQVVLYTQNEDISMDASLSHLLVEWGQWLDHDLTLTPQSPSTSTFRTGADCTRTCSRDTPCFPIQIPLTDPRSGLQSCMPFFRSAPSCVVAATPLRHREQLNAITSFVDASMVYGSSASLSAALRNLSSPLGLLALNPLHADGGLAYMPYLPRPPSTRTPAGRAGGELHRPGDPRGAGQPDLLLPGSGPCVLCVCAGDSRANEHLGMIALHTLFLREHNRLAGRLHLVNPHWGPETLYQEARKIVGAVHQVLTWDRYLPRVLGESGFRSLLPPYRGYGAEADPSIANAFSTAAFRFAHVTVQPRVARLGPGYAPSPDHPPLPPPPLSSPPGGWCSRVGEGGWRAVAVDDRWCPFSRPAEPPLLTHECSGTAKRPGYSAWRQLCNLSVPVTGPDLAQTLGNRSLAQKLLGLYGTPRNIDLWVGAISEPPLPGAGGAAAGLPDGQTVPGPERRRQREGVFSEAQRAELQRVSLSRIICDNTHIAHVPPDPFARTQRPGDVLPCSHPLIPHLDLNPICGAIPRLKFGFSLLCDSALLYRCHDGYRLNGPSSIRCDHSSNQWSPAPPTCQESDGLPSGSVSSLVSAVMAVVGGIAALALVIICYRRFVLKRHKPVIGGCCQRKDQWNGGDHALKEGTSQ